MVFKGTSSFGSFNLNLEDDLQNDPFESVKRMRTRYDQVGLAAPKPKKSWSLPELAIKVIDYPDNIFRSLLLGDGLKDVGKAISGKKTFSVRDKLSTMQNGAAKTGFSILGDILLSPTTYLGGGLIKTAGKQAMKSGLVKGMAQRTAGEVVKATVKKSGLETTSVYDALTKFKQPVTPEMNSLQAAKAVLGDAPVTGQNMADFTRRTRTALTSPASELNTAQHSMGGYTVSATHELTSKKLRPQLLGEVLSGKINATHPVSTGTLSDVFNRIAGAVKTPLTGDHIMDVFKMHDTGAKQLDTLLNVVDKYGTKVKDFDSLLNMSKRYSNVDFVDKIVKANERLLGAQKSFDEANVRVIFANQLVADIDKLGNKRFWGIMTPTGKAILPLVDVSPVAQALSKVGDAAYKHVPGYAPISNWFRTAIAGDFTRDAYMRGGSYLEQLQQGRSIVKSYDQLNQVVPHIGGEFVKQGLGKEIMDADPRILIGAVYGAERKMLREVEEGVKVNDPYSTYIYGSITDTVKPGEMEFARNYILENSGEEGLQAIEAKIIQPFLKQGAKLTPEEITLAEKYYEKAEFNTNVMWAHEKIQGLDNAEGFRSWYVYHMYEYGNPNLSMWDRLNVGAQSAKSAGMSGTSTVLRANHARDFQSLGEAIATDLRISKPIDNLVETTAARFNTSLRYGMNRSLINGLDSLFESKLQNEFEKSVIDKDLAYEHTVRVASKDVTTSVDEATKAKNADLRAGGQATVDTIIKALGGSEGLKALKEIIRPATLIHQSDIASKMWIPIDNIFGMTRAGGSGSLYYAHRELAPYLELVSKPTSDSMALRQLLETTDAATRIIKKLQTTMNPPFAFRNIVGESLLSIFGNGTSIDSINTAGKILHSVVNTTELNSKDIYVSEAFARLKVLPDTDMVTMGGAEMTVAQAREAIREGNTIDLGNGMAMTAQELHDTAKRYGLVNAGHTSEYTNTQKQRLKQSIGGVTWKERVKNEAKGISAPVKMYASGMESLSNYGDALFRLADYVHNIRQGMTEAEAAMRVKAFHVDYTDLTNFEKTVMRRIVPYYTFMRKNIPIQLKLMAERPAYYGTVGKMLDNSYAALGDPSAPDYLHKNMAFPIYEDESGNITYLNWNLPMADLAKFRLDPRETAKELMQTLHPGIKAPFELATGKSIAFGTPIKPVDYLSNQLGGASTAYKAAKQAFTPEEDFVGEYAKPKQVPLMQSLVPTVNPTQEELNRAYAYREQLLADMKKRKNSGKEIPELKKSTFGFGGKGVYERNPNYLRNQDWIHANRNLFTP